MAFADPSRLAEWHAHYLRNIANLQTVPGFLASQRFESLADTPSPFSALHEIASADVFESTIYKQRGGRASNGDWQKDMINWHRNLYSGLDATPEVVDDAYLLFIDAKRDVAEREIAVPPGVDVHWLTLVGLDRTIPHRGIAVLDDAQRVLAIAKVDSRVKLFRPMTGKIRQAKAITCAPSSAAESVGRNRNAQTPAVDGLGRAALAWTSRKRGCANLSEPPDPPDRALMPPAAPPTRSRAWRATSSRRSWASRSSSTAGPAPTASLARRRPRAPRPMAIPSSSSTTRRPRSTSRSIRSLPYHTLKDFAPLTRAGSFAMVLVVNPAVPAASVEEFLAWARAGKEINFGSGGVGSAQHVLMEMLISATGLRLTHVPYRGVIPAMNDVVAGHIPMMVVGLAGSLGAIRSGLLRPIAMTGAKRAAELPDVPTLAEKGIAGFPAEPWTAFFAPAGTPEPILARLSGGLVEALNDAGVREKLKPVMEVEASTPEALRGMVERDIERYGNLVRDVGMKVE